MVAIWWDLEWSSYLVLECHSKSEHPNNIGNPNVVSILAPTVYSFFEMERLDLYCDVT